MTKTKAEVFMEKQISDLHNLNAQYRGEIINHAINTETYLEMIIADYFTNADKRKAKELKHWLLSTNMFNYSTKIKMYLSIQESIVPEVKITEGEFKQITKIRNQMAHGKLVFYSDKLEDVISYDNNTITLYEWKTEKNIMVSKPIKLTRKLIDKEIKHITSVNDKLKLVLAFIKSNYKRKV